MASETHVYELKLLSLSTLMRVGLKVYIQNCGLGVWKGDLEKKDARTIMVCYIEYVCTEPIPTSFSILECKISFKEKKTASSVEQKAVALSCKSLSWSFFFSSWEAMLVWVSHRISEWRAGFIKSPPALNTWVWRPLVSLVCHVTYAHAARSDSFSIFTSHPGGHGSTKTALHHEVLHPTALLPFVGVARVFSGHHRGKWQQTGI